MPALAAIWWINSSLPTTICPLLVVFVFICMFTPHEYNAKDHLTSACCCNALILPANDRFMCCDRQYINFARWKDVTIHFHYTESHQMLFFRPTLQNVSITDKF